MLLPRGARADRRRPLDWLSLAPMKVQALFSTTRSRPRCTLRRPLRAHARAVGVVHQVADGVAPVTLALAPRARDGARVAGALRSVVRGGGRGTVAVHCVFLRGDRYHFVFTPLLCRRRGSAPAEPGAGREQTTVCHRATLAVAAVASPRGWPKASPSRPSAWDADPTSAGAQAIARGWASH